MPQQTINLGATGSGAGGDTARTAFEKIIANFGELYPAALPDTAAQKQAAREMFGAENASNLTSGTLPDARVSSTLPADKAFRRGNLLGTVSQSGGVPTGAIIERGSNANGEYVRWADGTQICWALVEGEENISSPFGGVFVSNIAQAAKPFPASFQGSPIRATKVSAVGKYISLISSFTDTQSWGGQQAFGLISLGTTYVIHEFIAIGRWY